MRFIYPFLSLFMVMPLVAQQPEHNNDQPSAELLEFLAEFNMLNEDSDKDYDLIQHHALQDFKKKAQQENSDDL